MSISNVVVFIENDETYANNRSGKCVMLVCQEIMCSAIERILNNPCFDKSNPVVIADYGTADGSNAIPTIKKMIDIIRNRLGEKQDILLVFEDQEANNYNALFDVINGLRRGHKELPHFDENTFVVASSKDMFKQCMPSKSVDLVLSTIAVQTLSCLPCTIKRGISIADANEEEYVLLKRQSAKDWKQFITVRGKELKPGGRMVIGTLAKFPNGKSSEILPDGYESLSVCLKDLVKIGIITQDEFERTALPQDHIRTEAELRHIFKVGDEDIQRYELEIESIEFKEVEYNSGVDLSGGEKDEDLAQEYARNVVKTTKGFLYNTIYNSLGGQRSEADRKEIAEKYFQQLYNNVLKAKRFPPYIIRIAVVVIAKGTQQNL